MSQCRCCGDVEPDVEYDEDAAYDAWKDAQAEAVALRAEQTTTVCEVHTLVGPDLETLTMTCEECGYTEVADPRDVAEQERLLGSL